MRVVLDTNIFLIGLPGKSLYHSMFQALTKGLYELAISNEILLEYEEIITSKANSFVAKNTLELLHVLPNVFQTDVYYKWNLITEDPDDNKFIDCMLASNSDFFVTHDNHFKVLASLNFPKITIINADEFIQILRNI